MTAIWPAEQQRGETEVGQAQAGRVDVCAVLGEGAEAISGAMRRGVVPETTRTVQHGNLWASLDVEIDAGLNVAQGCTGRKSKRLRADGGPSGPRCTTSRLHHRSNWGSGRVQC
jgi:hypothetical protein